MDWSSTDTCTHITGKGVVAHLTSSSLIVMMLDVTTELENGIPEWMFGNSVSCWHTMFKSAPDFIYWESLQSKLQKILGLYNVSLKSEFISNIRNVMCLWISQILKYCLSSTVEVQTVDYVVTTKRLIWNFYLSHMCKFFCKCAVHNTD